MADIVLVHGGLHGAACWDLLRPELEKRGHRTIAMDLPVDQPNVWMDGYADAALAAVEGKIADDAYLVGHSMGGMVIPRMAARLPKARLIFLCAGFAHTDEDEHRQVMGTVIAGLFDRQTIDDQGRVTMTKENAIDVFYHDVPLEVADWAYAKLRPHWAEGFFNVGPAKPYADRVAHIIHTNDDRIIDPAKHRRIAEKWFGITPILLPGGHSPFLSHPAVLAEVIDLVVAADKAKRA